MNFTNRPVLKADGSVPAEFYDEDYWERGAESGKGSYNTNVHPLEACKYWAQDTYNRWGPFKTYLELGCGRGWALYGFLNLPEIAVEPQGVDLSHYAVTTAHEQVRPYLVEASVAYLDFIADQSKDLIFSNDLMEHLTVGQIEQCLSHCRRIAKKRVVHLVSVGDDVDLPFGQIPSDQDQSHVTMRSKRWWRDIFDEVFIRQNSYGRCDVMLIDHGRTIEMDVRRPE